MNTALRLILPFVLAAACGSASAGGAWYADSGLHRHHGVRVHAHGSHFSLGLSFGFPLLYGSTRSYTPRYRYYDRRPVVVYRHAPTVVYRPAPVVVYRQAPRVVFRQAPRVVYGQATSPRPRGCREFNTTIIIGGRPQPAWGVACRGADGAWRVVN